MSKLALALLLITGLGGCQTKIDSSLSYVEPLPAAIETKLGKEIAGYVAQVWPAAQSSVLLTPPQPNELDNALLKVLTAELLNAGFAVVTPESVGVDAHRLKYCVTTYDGGVLLRLSVDDAPVARYYALGSNGELSPTSPMTVRN